MVMEEKGLSTACTHLARQVLYGNGSESKDVVETLAGKFLAICEQHQHYVRCNRESDNVIENSVWYLADVHAIPPMGTSTSWFSEAMSVLIELAVPNTALGANSARLMPQIQEGIAQSLANSPISKEDVRLDDEDARTIKLFESAGSEYGIVSDLLDLVQRLHHGDPLDAEEKRLFHVASLAAPLTRRTRIESGIDKDI
jgi:hypothetical protein